MLSTSEYNAATHSVNALLSVSVIVKAISFVEKAKQVLLQVLHQGGSGVKVKLKVKHTSYIIIVTRVITYIQKFYFFGGGMVNGH